MMENSDFRVVEAPQVLIRGRKPHAKSGPIDAVHIACRTLPIVVKRLTVPRNGDERQALRILLGVRSQITHQATAMFNTVTALVRTNDLGTDARKPLPKKQIRQISVWRTRDTDSFSQSLARAEAKRIATGVTTLWEEAKDNLAALDALTQSISPALRTMIGVGPVSSAQCLISWPHPGRIHSEAAFAALAGASPIPASSRNTQRQRMNRGGDRQLNQALHNVSLVRMRTEPNTRTYVEKRTRKTKANVKPCAA